MSETAELRARVKAFRDAAASVAAWDQPQEGWSEENRCDRETVRRIAGQLRAMASSAESRLRKTEATHCNVIVPSGQDAPRTWRCWFPLPCPHHWRKS